MSSQGGWVKLEQSDMRLAWNIARNAQGWFLRAAIEDTHYLIKKPLAKVREEKQCGVVFPGHSQVTAAIERHPAMVRENQTDGCLPRENGTVKNLQTYWSRAAIGAPPPEHVPLPPGTAPAPPCECNGTPACDVSRALQYTLNIISSPQALDL